MNKPTLIVSLLIVAGTLILMGTTYAYFTATATSNEQQTTSGTLELTYEKGQDISLTSVFPSEESEAGIHEFSIENTGTLDTTYYLYLTNIVLQKDKEDTQTSNLKWKLYHANESYTTSDEVASGDFSDGNTQIELATDITITSGTKQYYVLKIWLQETGSVQNWDQGLTFSAQVEATTEKKNITKTLVGTIKEEAVLDNIASTYVTSPTGIDFSQISSDTNGKGVYILSNTVNDQYPIMYYRGAVENNNVKFANFCWKIVRTTETGGIKLIYNGTPDENGACTATGEDTSIGTSEFNSKYYDPTYVGYMYHENFQLKDDPTLTDYTNISDSTVYYYGENYSFNKDTKKFNLTGNKISGTWESTNQQALVNYPYTCLSTDENGTCDFLLRLKGYNSSTSAKVNYITYSSVDYSSILNNTTDSTIKEKIDSWYVENIQNKQDSKGISYASYLGDDVFCNDRSISSGDGFSISTTTNFSPFYRLLNQKKPSLSCTQYEDKFTVSPENGNGNLAYPVGLITIDEVAYAGGVYALDNPEYYLYTGQTYWTMSPYGFRSSNAHENVWYVHSTGNLNATWVAAQYGIRPAINLKNGTKASSGDGSISNPWIVG